MVEGGKWIEQREETAYPWSNNSNTRSTVHLSCLPSTHKRFPILSLILATLYSLHFLQTGMRIRLMHRGCAMFRPNQSKTQAEHTTCSGVFCFCLSRHFFKRPNSGLTVFATWDWKSGMVQRVWRTCSWLTATPNKTHPSKQFHSTQHRS